MTTKNKTTSNPTVSVIMPVFNAEKYVSEAIRSIQNQTLISWELLIIDDGSKDGTVAILKQYAKSDKRIKLFLNQKNLGMATSLNKLIPLTTGTYIARMDADDISLPERFQKQVELLEKNKKLVACGGHEYIINSDGVILSKKKFPISPSSCRNIQLLFMAIQPPVLMARGSVMRKFRYDTQGARNGDDISLYFKLLQYGEFSNVDAVIFQYRILDTSTTHSNVKKSFWMSFGVRIEALISRTYTANPLYLVLFLIETVIVTLIPGFAVKWLFEFYRHRQNPADTTNKVFTKA